MTEMEKTLRFIAYLLTAVVVLLIIIIIEMPKGGV